MLKVKLSNQAKKQLIAVAGFVEEINTLGSGEKWYQNFRTSLLKYAHPIKYALCRHKKFAVKNYHCVTVKNWLVVFSIEDAIFYVRYIIHSSLMK
ncbi:MAG: hypothetical protein KA457_09875 [Chitinophagales bacterium]|jgi:hypothetical protein|nr:hypothetical protein [Chitinophagales bacterium]MBP6155118.1 hypothetical protein [Chitinophagales bacterium]HRB66429.1 hypothetical protein [Chitinophagales bacterium]